MIQVYLPRRRSRLLLLLSAVGLGFFALSLTVGYASLGLSRIVMGRADEAFYSAVMR